MVRIKIPSMKIAAVLVAESLDEEAIYREQREGVAVAEIGRLLCINMQYRQIISRDSLKRAVEEARKSNAIILHLSCHGDAEGIQLTDGSEITWSELAELTQPHATPARALVVSACSGGVHGLTKHLGTGDLRPYGFIIGPSGNIALSDACVAWCLFYRRLIHQGQRLTRDAILAAVKDINSYLDVGVVSRRWDTNAGKYLKFEGKRSL
jgi:hypothetical protein